MVAAPGLAENAEDNAEDEHSERSRKKTSAVCICYCFTFIFIFSSLLHAQNVLDERLNQIAAELRDLYTNKCTEHPELVRVKLQQS